MSTLPLHLLSLVPRDDGHTFQCQSERASDYYGLGVRLGIYFAWLGGYLANTILPSEFDAASNTNTIFLLTLLVAMTNDSRTSDLSQIDGLILMHLCGGTVFGILSLWGYRTRVYRDGGPGAIRGFGGFSTHIKLAVSLGVSAFGMWFWLFGVAGRLKPMGPEDGTDPPNPPECGELFTFFFAKIKADGGIRYYYIVVCSTCIAYFGVMFIASSLGGWASFERVAELAQFKTWSSMNRARYITGFTHKELTIIFKFLRWANLFWLLFSAIMVECTLNFNHVNNVLGGQHDGGLHLPSQLLPFLVGVLSFLRTLYAIFKDKWGKDDLKKLGTSENVQAAGAGFDDLQMIEHEAPNIAPGSPGFVQQRQKIGSLPVRYLVAWLPWLGLVLHSNRQDRLSTLMREGTGLSKLSQA